MFSILNSTVPNAEQVAQSSAPGKFLTPTRDLIPFGFLALTLEKHLHPFQSAKLHTDVRTVRMPNHPCSRHSFIAPLFCPFSLESSFLCRTLRKELSDLWIRQCGFISCQTSRKSTVTRGLAFTSLYFTDILHSVMSHCSSTGAIGP